MVRHVKLLILLPAWLVFASHAGAELPHYSITPVESFFPALGPDQGVYGSGTRLYGISAGGTGYLAAFTDFEHPVTPPNSQIITPAETNYIVNAGTLTAERTGAPPPGYITGTSGAVFSSSAGHMVFSVSGQNDRNTPGWQDRIQVARTNPDGSTTVLPGGLGIEQRGVNSGGTVIGVGSDETTAWRYTDALGWQSLGSLGPSGSAHPRGINDSGMIVGRTENAGGSTIPFFYTESGGMKAITNSGTEIFGRAEAVNNSGLVTGIAEGRAFLFDADSMELKYVTPVASQRTVDVNNLGQVIGYFEFGPVLGVPGDTAWIASETDSWTHISSLVEGNLASGEWSVNQVFDINDDGSILANAYNYFDHKSYQVLLRTIPEPTPAILCLAALFPILWRRRR